jgi:DNA repair exonuclease SbcCD ATPase subunit
MALNFRLTGCSEELLRLQQRCELLREQVRRIPEVRDELQMWQKKKQADQKKSDLLDDTMALLEQAKENLATSFMGPIRSSFTRYLDKLWAQQEGKVLVTADLDVQMERHGIARELGYFSAGQMDMVMLCMRFALVDALFAEEKPFVILDDLFVNLDDNRTAEAICLLGELAADRQIIYLTCSSSRSPK